MPRQPGAGRPPGQFNEMKLKLYFLLRDLAGLGAAYATTKWLAKRLNRSEVQIQKYLKALKDEGEIAIKTTKANFNFTDKRFYRKRLIRIRRHEGSIARSGIKFTRLPPEEPDEVVLGNHDAAMEAIYAAVRANEEERKQREYFATLNEDQQFDKDAVLRELAAELAEQGIIMELHTDGNVSP